MWRPTGDELTIIKQKLSNASNPTIKVNPSEALENLRVLYRKPLKFNGYFETLEELVATTRNHQEFILTIPDKPLFAGPLTQIALETNFTDDYRQQVLKMYSKYGYDNLFTSDCEVKSRKLLSVLATTDLLTDYAKRYYQVALTSGHHIVMQDYIVFLAGRQILKSSCTGSA